MKPSCAILLLLTLAVAGCRPFNGCTFDQAAWASSDYQGRASMADDLIANHIEPGMLSETIEGMLGAPDDVLQGGRDSGGNPLSGSSTYSYYLGNWSMGGMDDAYLYVHLDDHERVLKAEVQGY